LEESKVYPIESEIRSLEIQINAANFVVKQAESFSVESNLKYLSVSEEDGVLTVLDEFKGAFTYNDAELTLYVPYGTVFESANIVTGTAVFTVDALSVKSLKLQLGAGDVKIENLTVTDQAENGGGAGKITVTGGALNDLTLEMGVGELNLAAALSGNSTLLLGVGKSNLTLLGSRDDYTIDIEKGLGSITVDGKEISDFGSSGNGQNHVTVEGGIGAIHLTFAP